MLKSLGERLKSAFLIPFHDSKSKVDPTQISTFCNVPPLVDSHSDYLELMHLSMLSRRGERPGVGGGFDVTSLPVAGTFDHSSSPGGRDF